MSIYVSYSTICVDIYYMYHDLMYIYCHDNAAFCLHCFMITPIVRVCLVERTYILYSITYL